MTVPKGRLNICFIHLSRTPTLKRPRWALRYTKNSTHYHGNCKADQKTGLENAVSIPGARHVLLYPPTEKITLERCLKMLMLNWTEWWMCTYCGDYRQHRPIHRMAWKMQTNSKDNWFSTDQNRSSPNEIGPSSWTICIDQAKMLDFFLDAALSFTHIFLVFMQMWTIIRFCTH